MFAEDLTVFMNATTGFAVTATLNAAPVSVIFDTEGAEVFGNEVITAQPSAIITATQGASAAAGQSLVIGSTTYTVRSVQPEPPDGAFKRLGLARA